MDFLPFIFAGALVVLTLVLTVVGIQMVLVLLELKKTLKRANAAIDAADQKLHALVNPLQQLAGMATSMNVGMKVFESFVVWLKRHDKER
jgi:hypothetical protein